MKTNHSLLRSPKKLLFWVLVFLIVFYGLLSLIPFGSSSPELKVRLSAVLLEVSYTVFIALVFFLLALKLKILNKQPNANSVMSFVRFSTRSLLPFSVRKLNLGLSLLAALAILFSFIVIFTSIYVSLKTNIDLANGVRPIPPTSHNIAIALLHNLQVAFFEEFAYRVILFYIIVNLFALYAPKQKRTKFILIAAYLLISSILFGFSHLWKSPEGQLIAAFFGMSLGIVFIVTRSMVPIIVIHFLNNSLHLIITKIGLNFSLITVFSLLAWCCFILIMVTFMIQGERKYYLLR